MEETKMKILSRTISTTSAWRLGPSASWSCRLCVFFQAEDGIRDLTVTGVQTCALPIWVGEALRFATAMSPFWRTQGRIDAGRRLIATVLALPASADQRRARARAWYEAGVDRKSVV